jgi:hypothetical protein
LARISTSLPFPSSPHWDPRITQTLECNPLRHGLYFGKILVNVFLNILINNTDQLKENLIAKIISNLFLN